MSKIALRGKIVGICAVILMAVGWRVAQLPGLSSTQLARLAQPFAFKKEPLNGAATPRAVRQVAHSLEADPQLDFRGRCRSGPYGSAKCREATGRMHRRSAL